MRTPSRDGKLFGTKRKQRLNAVGKSDRDHNPAPDCRSRRGPEVSRRSGQDDGTGSGVVDVASVWYDALTTVTVVPLTEVTDQTPSLVAAETWACCRSLLRKVSGQLELLVGVTVLSSNDDGNWQVTWLPPSA